MVKSNKILNLRHNYENSSNELCLYRTTVPQDCTICSGLKYYRNDRLGVIFVDKTAGTRKNRKRQERKKETTTVGFWLKNQLMSTNLMVWWLNIVFLHNLISRVHKLGRCWFFHATPTPLAHGVKIFLPFSTFKRGHFIWKKLISLHTSGIRYVDT